MELSTSTIFFSHLFSDERSTRSFTFFLPRVWRLLSSFPVPGVLILISHAFLEAFSLISSRRPHDLLLPYTVATAGVSLRM
jgi:hypothetical protein